MTTQPSRSPLSALVWGMIAPAVLWASVFAALLIAAPRFLRRYQDYGLSVPHSTQLAFDAAAWANNYWYVLAIWLLIFLPAATLIAVVVGRRLGRGVNWFWCGLMLVLPLLAAVLLALAFYEAETKLHQAMGG